MHRFLNPLREELNKERTSVRCFWERARNGAEIHPVTVYKMHQSMNNIEVLVEVINKLKKVKPCYYWLNPKQFNP